VGGLEMLAIEMKATGAYLSRGLSYKGAEFELQARIVIRWFIIQRGHEHTRTGN